MGKDVWFDNVQVLHYNTQVLEENHYYPFGLTLSTTAMGTTPQPLKYNGKELETSFGLQTYEYGARQYNSQIGRWNGVDPLADKYYGVSPFAYVANNPVIFVDPDGKAIKISGEKLDKAVSELRKATNLNFEINSDGMLSVDIMKINYSNLNNYDLNLLSGILDPQIRVIARANFDALNSNGSLLNGGALISAEYDPTTGHVTTKQDLNPDYLQKLDLDYKKPGQTLFHEVLESYEAGKIVLEDKSSYVTKPGDETNPNSVYSRSHINNNVPPQSGKVNMTLFDKEGDIVVPTGNGKFVKDKDNSIPSVPYKIEDRTTNGTLLQSFK